MSCCMLPARDNPFAVHRVLQVRYRMDERGWSALIARLEAGGWRGAIIGPHGAGKTTLLEDLADRLAKRDWRVHWVRLSTERRRPTGEFWRSTLLHLGSRDALMIDGAEQLSRWRAWLLARRWRRVGAVIITSHRPGRLPTVHRCVASPELLGWLVERLGERVGPQEAQALFERHRGNLRDALRELYDRYSRSATQVTSAAAVA